MSLRDFLHDMERKNEVIHIRNQVSPRYEISSIMKSLDAGPILLFDKVSGYRTRVVANVCGTRERICSALNVASKDLYKQLVDAWRSPTPAKIVKEGPVKEVVEKADLSKIPILTHFEKDATPYITSGIVSARSLDGKVENVSIHRLMVVDKNRLGIRIVPRQLFKLWSMAKEEGEDLEVAISIGLHPTLLLAATSVLPFGVSEFNVANVLLKGGLKLVKCQNVNAYAPADAELVLEGIISVKNEILEGPLVDVTGTYDIQRNQPVVEIVSMMHCEDYIYQAILPSGTEHKLLMGLPRETMIWEAVTNVVPFVKAVNLSPGGSRWLHAIISIEKQTEGDGKNALVAAFAAHPSLKHVIVVDTDIDIFNLEDVEWAVATRFQANEDLLIIPNARGSSLDPSADQKTGLTTKLGIDATCPLAMPREKFTCAKIPTSERVKKIIGEIKKST
ncbi:MAG: UbiD family decarboxylase [Candidatus Bathyarchaeota archaeon]|nr:UbiD family decarboxylase [Candidatus Bathyarchaeota archaeon]MDH5732749.1 UbiD family decarboxylase [Candidatus Bathyarchaeota archaeon]